MYYILKFRIDSKKNSGTFYGAPAGCGFYAIDSRIPNTSDLGSQSVECEI